MPLSKLSITALTGDMSDAQPDFEYAFSITHRRSVDACKEEGGEVVDSPACKWKPSCCVCARGVPRSYNTPPTWAEVCYLTMYALSLAFPDHRTFHIREEVCVFIDAHYDVLCQKTRSSVWKQTVNMTLSHPQYANMFLQEAAFEKGRKGFYGLRETLDPYEQEPAKRKKRKVRSEDRGKRRSSTDVGIEGNKSNNKGGKRRKNSNSGAMEWNFVSHNTEGKVEVKDMIKKLENELFSCFLRHQKEYQSEDEENDTNKEEEEKAAAEDLAVTEQYKKNRQMTTPEEKEILEKYYLHYFQGRNDAITTTNDDNCNREKLNMDLLASSLGWTKNRIIRWFDNRKTKDRTKSYEVSSSNDDDNLSDQEPMYSNEDVVPARHDYKGESHDNVHTGNGFWYPGNVYHVM